VEAMTGPELVVVTGAGSGMGRDIAVDQARLGRHVVLVGRRRDPLEQTAAAGAAAGVDAGAFTVVAADTSTTAGAQELVAAVAGRPVTGVVAAAGGQGDFRAHDAAQGGAASADQAWTEALRKNLFTAVLPVEALLPLMAEGSGRIVLIGSTSGSDGSGGPYATAKAALAGYGRDLAVRAGARQITANTVAPGFVADTEFFEAGGLGDGDRFIEDVAAQTLVGRVGRPADVTSAVRWLLASDAGWVTGQTIVVSGGTVLAR